MFGYFLIYFNIMHERLNAQVRYKYFSVSFEKMFRIESFVELSRPTTSGIFSHQLAILPKMSQGTQRFVLDDF